MRIIKISYSLNPIKVRETGVIGWRITEDKNMDSSPECRNGGLGGECKIRSPEIRNGGLGVEHREVAFSELEEWLTWEVGAGTRGSSDGK